MQTTNYAYHSYYSNYRGVIMDRGTVKSLADRLKRAGIQKGSLA
jgi:hypothetical protein